MRPWLPLIAFLWLTASVVPGPACAGGTREEALRNFLRDRDAERVYLALEALGEPADGPVMRLLDQARDPTRELAASDSPTSDARGRTALPEVIDALRALDLERATRAAARADDADGGMAGAWAGALVRVRRGDDRGGVGRLLAPPLFEWDRDAFALALLGAALPPEDRIMLEAAGRLALKRAAERGRVRALSGTALALAALHPHAGREAFVLAVRALRRHGDADAAEELLATAPRAGVPRTWPALAFEAALTAWQAGRTADVGALLAGVSPPAGAQASFLALRRARRRGATIDTGRGLKHAVGEVALRALIARYATTLGVPTQPDDIERWSGRLGAGAPSSVALAQRFLEHKGLVVLRVAGDAAAGDAALAAGRPFLLMRLARADAGYADVPVLVRGYDRRTGLYLLDEPHVGRIDVLPRTAAAKARLLVAVPAEERALVAPFAATQPARLGRALEEILDEAERGDLAAAIARFGAKASGGVPIARLYEAHLLHRLAVREHSDDVLAMARALIERSRRTPPLLGFEAYVRGQALLVAGERAEGLAAYDRAVRLEGASETVAMARFAALQMQGDRGPALAAADVARRLAPLDRSVLFYRGNARVRAGDLAGARADFRWALDRRVRREFDPRGDALPVAVALASLELDAGRPAIALDVLRETVRKNSVLASDETLRFHWRLAETALIEAAKTVDALENLRRSPEPDTRRRLAFALAEREYDGADAEALLRTLLADDDDGVRASTLRLYMRPWLRKRVESDAVLGRRVCLLLEKDPAANVRGAAAALLGRVEAPFGIRALTAGLSGDAADPEPAVRSAAARALEAHDGPATREVLVAALDDVDVSVRRAAIDTLFRIAATTFDFEAEAEAAARAVAVAKWRAWLAEER